MRTTVVDELVKKLDDKMQVSFLNAHEVGAMIRTLAADHNRLEARVTGIEERLFNLDEAELCKRIAEAHQPKPDEGCHGYSAAYSAEAIADMQTLMEGLIKSKEQAEDHLLAFDAEIDDLRRKLA